MKFIDRVMPRDVIAIIVLAGCGFLLYKGIDSFVTAITALIIGYYFSKRVYEEKNPQKASRGELPLLANVKSITLNEKPAPALKSILSKEEKLKEFSGHFKPVLVKD